jgi:DNA-binding CsgD family transcriptional regulator
MAAAAILKIQVNVIKWAIRPILMKLGTQTKTDMLKLKITKAGV